MKNQKLSIGEKLMQKDDLRNVGRCSNNIMSPTILICECNSTEHQIVIYPDNEDGLVYCHIHLVKYGFLRRLKAGLKYIFGYKCKFGQWDEFIFKPEHAGKLRELSEMLSRHKG